MTGKTGNKGRRVLLEKREETNAYYERDAYPEFGAVARWRKIGWTQKMRGFSKNEKNLPKEKKLGINESCNLKPTSDGGK